MSKVAVLIDLGFFLPRYRSLLYRIFVYDCKPLAKKAHHPVTGKAIDFSRTAVFEFRNELHRELVCMRKVALRLGELADDSQWLVRAEAQSS